VTHGAAYLAFKAEGALAQRARAASRLFALLWTGLFAIAGLWLWHSGYGLAITGGADPNSTPNLLGKTAVASAGAWLLNYRRWPVSMLLPAIGLAAPLLVAALAGSRGRLAVFALSSVGIAGVIGTAGLSLFPF